MADTKQILVLVGEAGLGHRKAAEAILTVLQESYGDACRVEMVNPLDDECTPAVLRDSQDDYDTILQHVPDLYRLGYKAANSAVTASILEVSLILMLYPIMRDLLERVEPDVIVTTYPHFQAPMDAVAAVRGKAVPLVTVVTDLVTVHRIWFNDAAHLCLVPTPEARRRALDAGLDERKVKVVGIPVDPDLAAGAQDKVALRSQLGWRVDLTTLLAVGGKRVRGLNEILHVLNHSGLPIQLVVLAGRDEDLHCELQSTEWHVAARVYGFVEDMPTFMRASDCVLCKAGGLIVSEASASGLPCAGRLGRFEKDNV